MGFSSLFWVSPKTLRPLKAENRPPLIEHLLLQRLLSLFSSYHLLFLLGLGLTFDLNQCLGPIIRILPLPNRRVELEYYSKRLFIS